MKKVEKTGFRSVPIFSGSFFSQDCFFQKKIKILKPRTEELVAFRHVQGTVFWCTAELQRTLKLRYKLKMTEKCATAILLKINKQRLYRHNYFGFQISAAFSLFCAF